MRSDYVQVEEFRHILAALTPENRLALEISLYTGLRIGDVLAIKTEQVKKRRFGVRESKTGKYKRVSLSLDLFERALTCCGKIYLFEHRLTPYKHRTRQAVYKDIKRAAKLFRLNKKLVISPHSARKIYAVEAFKEYGNIEKIKNLLNHSDEAVTMIYIMSEQMTERKLKK